MVCLLGNFPALSGLSLNVDAAELLVVEGPNGAGKTTLLRVCAGLQPVVSGSARVCGFDVRLDPRGVRRHVGYLGHRSLLYDDLTVEDNVMFALQISRSSKRGSGSRSHDLQQTVANALASVGIDQRVAKLALHACSAGQRRRTALAAVVARQPRLWLLDEPHSGLDSDAKEALDDLLKTAVNNGATVIVVSHDQERVKRFATRSVTVAGGHVVADTPIETRTQTC